jgi:toxin ParE1/3/4
VRTWRLSAAAEQDIVALLNWTVTHLGASAQERYQRLLVTALRDVADDPERVGSVVRPELGDGVRSYHIRHSRNRCPGDSGIVRRPRHLILYRSITPGVVGVGRVLHDGMEFGRHLPDDYADQ